MTTTRTEAEILRQIRIAEDRDDEEPVAVLEAQLRRKRQEEEAARTQKPVEPPTDPVEPPKPPTTTSLQGPRQPKQPPQPTPPAIEPAIGPAVPGQVQERKRSDLRRDVKTFEDRVGSFNTLVEALTRRGDVLAREQQRIATKWAARLSGGKFVLTRQEEVLRNFRRNGDIQDNKFVGSERSFRSMRNGLRRAKILDDRAFKAYKIDVDGLATSVNSYQVRLKDVEAQRRGIVSTSRSLLSRSGRLKAQALFGQQRQKDALGKLKDFTDVSGRINVSAALQEGVTAQTLLTAGVAKLSITEARARERDIADAEKALAEATKVVLAEQRAIRASEEKFKGFVDAGQAIALNTPRSDFVRAGYKPEDYDKMREWWNGLSQANKRTVRLGGTKALVKLQDEAEKAAKGAVTIVSTSPTEAPTITRSSGVTAQPQPELTLTYLLLRKQAGTITKPEQRVLGQLLGDQQSVVAALSAIRLPVTAGLILHITNRLGVGRGVMRFLASAGQRLTGNQSGRAFTGVLVPLGGGQLVVLLATATAAVVTVIEKPGIDEMQEIERAIERLRNKAEMDDLIRKVTERMGGTQGLDDKARSDAIVDAITKEQERQKQDEAAETQAKGGKQAEVKVPSSPSSTQARARVQAAQEILSVARATHIAFATPPGTVRSQFVPPDISAFLKGLSPSPGINTNAIWTGATLPQRTAIVQIVRTPLAEATDSRTLTKVETVVEAIIGAVPAPAPGPVPKPVPKPVPSVLSSSLASVAATTTAADASSARTTKGGAIGPSETRFELPSGVELPPGVFPRRAEWVQGKTIVTYDFQSGKARFSANKGKATVAPNESFRLLSTTKQPPKRRRLSLGIVAVDVTRRGLVFKRDGKIGRKSIKSRGLRNRQGIR